MNGSTSGRGSQRRGRPARAARHKARRDQGSGQDRCQGGEAETQAGQEVSAPAEVIVHRDAGLLAKAVAARLITRLVDAQASKGSASLVLTGGGMGGAHAAGGPREPGGRRRRLAAGRHLVGRRAVRRPRQRRPQREAGPRGAARPRRRRPRAHLPDGLGRRRGRRRRRRGRRALRRDPRLAYPPRGPRPGAALRRAAARPRPGGPRRLDLPGVAGRARGRAHGRGRAQLPQAAADPRQPDAAARSSRPHEVWVVAAGGEKADAARLALSGAGPLQVPAAGAVGRARTLWLLDRAAASALTAGAQPHLADPRSTRCARRSRSA